MIVDNMTKTEVMLSLKEEFKKEILPYYNNVLVERLKREVLPMVQRTGITQKKQFEKSTSGKNNFNLICTVKKRDYYLEAYCKFLWNNKTCFASFFDKESVVVYQKHCLERYAERVLGRKDMTPEDVFLKYLFTKQDSAFLIALQSPNRERCMFFGLSDALFLGDYDEPTMENKSRYTYWYNTCISLKETHATQTGILHSLAAMQLFVKELGFNPLISITEKKRFENFIKKSENHKQAYVEFLKRTYMLHQLQLSMKFPWIGIFLDEINVRMEKISAELAKYNVNTASLSPFGKEVGFAIKGEINFRV